MCEHCNCARDLEKVQLTVEGMTCGHCRKAVEEAVEALPGVADAIVDLEKKTLDVSYEKDQVTLEQIHAAIKDAGYQVA